MATYYVTQSGIGNGTSYANACSLAELNAETHFTLVPGDTVYLCDTITGTIEPDRNGTAGYPITYRGDYAGHSCTIDGEDTRATAFSIPGAGLDYITLDNFAITKHIMTDPQAVVHVYNSDNFIVQNLSLTHCISRGIMLEGCTNSLIYKNSIILPAETINVEPDQIYLTGGDSNIIDGNYLYNGITSAPSGWHIDGIQITTGEDNLIVRNNWIETGPSSSTYNHPFIMRLSTGYLKFYNNVLIKGNTVTGSEHCALFGESGDGAILDLYVWNNTFRNKTTTNGAFDTACKVNDSTITIKEMKNNIFWATGGYAVYLANKTLIAANMNYNILYTGYTYPAADTIPRTWAAWQGLGYEGNGYNVNPSLDAITYKSDSVSDPAVGKGIQIATITTDKDGNARGNPPDIGAYEYRSVRSAFHPYNISNRQNTRKIHPKF